MKDLFKSDRFIKAAFIVGIAVILLIFLSGTQSFFSNDNTEGAEEQLEQRLTQILSEIDGIEEAPRVMIRLAQDGLTVLGAAVVCGRADDPVIKEKLLDAVSKALDVSVSRVCITK